MAHFLPFTKVITSEETAEVVMHEVFWHHGLPDSIISDWGLNSFRNSGSISSKCLRSLVTSPMAITLKQTGVRISTKTEKELELKDED